jgi:hypothetical protein
MFGIINSSNQGKTFAPNLIISSPGSQFPFHGRADVGNMLTQFVVGVYANANSETIIIDKEMPLVAYLAGTLGYGKIRINVETKNMILSDMERNKLLKIRQNKAWVHLPRLRNAPRLAHRYPEQRDSMYVW